MKNLVFAFALLCSSSLVAQFSYNANGTGIQSVFENQTSSNTASGYSMVFAMGEETTASGIIQRLWVIEHKQVDLIL